MSHNTLVGHSAKVIESSGTAGSRYTSQPCRQLLSGTIPSRFSETCELSKPPKKPLVAVCQPDAYYIGICPNYTQGNIHSFTDPTGEIPFVPIAIFLAKEIAAELASQASGGATDVLSARRMAKKGITYAVKRIEPNRPTLDVSRSITPEIAKNIENAISQGAPTVLTREASKRQIRRNRRDALRGQQAAGPGQSLDEYPLSLLPSKVGQVWRSFLPPIVAQTCMCRGGMCRGTKYSGWANQPVLSEK